MLEVGIVHTGNLPVRCHDFLDSVAPILFLKCEIITHVAFDLVEGTVVANADVVRLCLAGHVDDEERWRCSVAWFYNVAGSVYWLQLCRAFNKATHGFETLSLNGVGGISFQAILRGAIWVGDYLQVERLQALPFLVLDGAADSSKCRLICCNRCLQLLEAAVVPLGEFVQ